MSVPSFRETVLLNPMFGAVTVPSVSTPAINDASPVDHAISFAISIEVMLFVVAVAFAILIAGFFAMVLIRQGSLDGEGRPLDDRQHDPDEVRALDGVDDQSSVDPDRRGGA